MRKKPNNIANAKSWRAWHNRDIDLSTIPVEIPVEIEEVIKAGLFGPSFDILFANVVNTESDKEAA